jgi:hypothetical protein
MSDHHHHSHPSAALPHDHGHHPLPPSADRPTDKHGVEPAHGTSLLMAGAWQRVAGAVALTGLLWAAVAWALHSPA